MIRGTTAQFKFKLPCIKGRLTYATVKFWQPGNNGLIEAKLPITKRLIDCSGIETDEIKNRNNWNSGQYDDVKKRYELPEVAWDELTDEQKRVFASYVYDELCISLSAEETLRFSDKSKARVQLRAQKIDETVFASQIQLITVYPINDDITTDDPSIPAEEEGFIVLNGGDI